MTASPTATVSLTPTNTVTPTVSPSTASVPNAYLLIEPDSDASEIGTFMFNAGASWYGFTNGSGPTSSSDLGSYLSYYNQNAGTGNVPSIVTATVPQSGGGNDSFGNAIEQYKFVTTEINSGTVSGDAWYTWIIADESIGGAGTANRVREIENSNGQGSSNLTARSLTSSYYTYTVTNPTGFANGTYRIYTTYSSQDFRLDNSSTTLYFKGGLVN